jgi:hypothetical protein
LRNEETNTHDRRYHHPDTDETRNADVSGAALFTGVQ